MNERVVVEVRFAEGGVCPLRFEWRGRGYEVRTVTMRFERKDGGRKFLCFAVEAGGMLAELVLDREGLTWSLGGTAPL